MSFKSGEAKAVEKVDRCITCRKPCSMSGLCMKPWPEFKVAVKKDAVK